MKILHVVGSLDPKSGGTAEAVLQMAHVMTKLGIVSEMLSLDHEDNTAAVAAATVYTVHLKGPENQSTYAYSKVMAEWLNENISAYDTVIIHGLWQFHGFATSRACRKANVPYFVFPHGMLDPWFNRTYPLKKYKKLLYWYWGENPVLRHAQAVLYTAEEEKLLARESFPSYRVNEAVVGLGTRSPEIDTAQVLAKFENSKPDWAKRPYFLFMSRIQEKKGLDNLAAAYAKLREEDATIPDLVIAGPIQQPEYAERIKTDTCQEGIHWIGSLDAQAKWPALIAAEAMVLISHQENFGIVVAEALAVGTPVLISNKINIWREVEAGGAGIVSNDNEDGAQAALNGWLKQSANERKQMIASTRPTFDKYFNIDQSTQTLVGTIKSCLPS